MSIFLTVIKNLPQIIALIKAIQNVIDAAETDHTVKSNLTALKGAIDAKDINQVNHLFNSAADVVVQPIADTTKS